MDVAGWTFLLVVAAFMALAWAFLARSERR